MRRREVHQRGLARHRDRLGERPDLERQIERHRLSDLQPDVLREPLEALKLPGDSVGTRDNPRDEIRTVGSGDRLPDRPALSVGDDDRHAGQDTLLLVDDTTPDGGSSSLLRLRGKRTTRQYTERQ